MTTIHTRQLQQHTKGNYNNTQKTTNTVYTRRLKIHVEKVNNTKVKEYYI